jgi:hypothetical protein
MFGTTTTLTGQSGAQYVFGVVPRNSIFKARPGVYVMAKRRGENKFSFCYVGQSADMSVRPLSPDKTECFNAFGTDCIFVLEELDVTRRAQIVADLVQAYRPSCNA